MTILLTWKMDGLEQTVANLGELPKATRRNTVSRVLKKTAEPIADEAARRAPHESGFLAFSIVASPTLTRRHRGEKVSEVEMHIGPAGGMGGAALVYASYVEFGTNDTPINPFMRSTWESKKVFAFDTIKRELGDEVERAAARLARKTARLGLG